MSYYRLFAHHLAYAALALALTCAGGVAAPAQAGTVDLSAAPPDLNTTVSPNIALTFDDSGSMSFAYMPDDHTSCSAKGGKFTYVGYNNIYYNPSTTYTPPLTEDGTKFPDVPFAAAPLDGYHDYIGTGAVTVDLSKGYIPTKNWNQNNNTKNNTIASGCVPSAVKSGKDTRAYYTLADGTPVDLTTITTGATVDGKTRTVAEEQQNFANWYSYYRTRNLMTKTAITQAFAGLQAPIRLVWQTIWPQSKSRAWSRALSTSDPIGSYQDTLDANGNVTEHGNKPAFFSWLLALGSSDGTPDRKATQRVGAYFTLPDKSPRTGTASDPYWNGETGKDSSKELACRQNYHVLVTDGYWNEADGEVTTPAKQADKLGSGTQNTPDGRASKVDESSIYWNVSTAYSKSLANIAYDYWATDLAPDIPDKVSPYLADASTSLWSKTVNPSDPWANNEIYFNPKNDPATWQHLDQFMVTLGINGTLAYPEDYKTLRLGTTAWPKAVHDSGSAIDDMWRAAVVSRGAYFSAADPAALSNRLSTIINSVAARAGSAVANTVNSGVWTTQSVAYRGSYNSADWSGTVRANKQTLVLDKDGAGNVVGSHTVLGDELWNAGCLLTGGGCTSGSETVADARKPNTRVILTSSAAGAGNGVAFEWGNLSASEMQALNADPATDINSPTIVSDGHGEDRLDWLRGDRSKEGSELRTRSSVMGSVIRSQPLYVAYPDSGYRDTFPKIGGTVAPENAKPYEDFVQSHKGRTPVLYVGANDGMLHAIQASDGKELFAYVPASVFWRSQPTGSNVDEPGVPNLSKLTAASNFQFVPTVDNTPVTRDVFFGDAWHTLLVGTLGMGGRGVYALDVTKPDDVTEANAASTVLWEFNNTSTGGADMGYTYGQPEIARLATGKWAVLVPGGYFPKNPLDPNHGADAASETFSSLVVVDAETGKLIRELKTSETETGTGTQSYGLGTPVLADYQDDQVDDVAFAGDLDGNLWRFDLSSPDKDSWQVDLVYKGKTTQPITAKPRLFPDPTTNQFIVVFGTGKYLGLDDRLRSGTPTQAIYGIREQGASGTSGFPPNYYPVDPNKPTNPDKLQAQKLVDQNGIRYLTNTQVPGDAKGWVIPLDTQLGERVVQRAGALFNTNQALISTLIPGGDDPCNPSRSGGQFLISAVTGGAETGIPSLGDPLPPTYDPAPIKDKLPPVGCEPGTGCGGAGSGEMPSISDSGSVQPVVVEPGGCRGVTASGLNIPMACWRRRSWSVLLDNQP